MRIARTILMLFVLVAALLVFPNRIPEFAGLWLAWCTFRIMQDRRAHLELVAIPVWLAFKWPEPTLWLLIFICSVCLSAWASLREKKQLKASLILWVLWLTWIVHHHQGTIRSGKIEPVNVEGPIVCLGDSLTDFGYPQYLESLIERPVADFGFNGYTTSDGLKLLPEMVALKPSTVVIELGGHDFKNGNSRSETGKNLRTMIEAFQDCGAEVMIAEIPRGFINDPWFGFERQLVREYDLDLIPDTMIRKLIFWSPIIPPGQFVSSPHRLSKDGLHPNAAGNQMMAETVARILNRRQRKTR
jgi:lysophospholipase L1-like esterase